MTTLIFLISIGIMLLYSLHRCKQDYCDPFFVFCLSIFVGMFIVTLNSKNWDVTINNAFMLCIVFAFCGWLLGDKVGKSIRFPNVKHTGLKVSIISHCENNYPYMGLLIFSVVLGGYFIITRIFLIRGQGFSGLTSMVRYLYDSRIDDSFLVNRVFEFEGAIAYISVHRLIMNAMYKIRIKGYLIVPIVFYLICIILRTDRNYFLRFAIYCICLWVLIYKEYNPGKSGRQIICSVGKMLIVMIVLFYLLGAIKQYQSSFLNGLSIYAGSGLYNFNLLMDDFTVPHEYGRYTFSTLSRTVGLFLSSNDEIRKFSFSGPVSSDGFIYFTSQNGTFYSSNIYSAFQAYFRDFGYFGVFLFPFIYGIFFRWLKKKADKNKCGYGGVLYSMLVYPIVYVPIHDQFIMRFHLGFLFEILTVYIVYMVVYGNKINKVLLKRNLYDIHDSKWA